MYIRHIFDGLLAKKKQILEQNKLEEDSPQCCGSGMIFSDPYPDHDHEKTMLSIPLIFRDCEIYYIIRGASFVPLGAYTLFLLLLCS